MNSADTIVAISSAVGTGGRMIVRVSGAEALRIVGEVSDSAGVEPGRAAPGLIYPGVRGWVYGFKAPRSYTGDDLVEFHVPGSPVLGRMLLDRVVGLGARPAEAGEFTARAYFNGRMDLTQAEGVAATIGAQSERELRAARQLLAGELARRLSPVMDSVAHGLALVEVGIDFTDEDVTFISGDEVRGRCESAVAELDAILAESARFERLAHEPRVVLVGRPNAGKSTLLNALAGKERAVVSPVAGTTRDAIWAEVGLARGMVRVVDVAGIEAVGSGQSAVGSVEAEIARQMRGQAMREVEGADLLALVEELSGDGEGLGVGRAPDLVVRTKGDLGPKGSALAEKNVCPTVVVSAVTGDGMEPLRAKLDELAFGMGGGGAGLALNARHVAAIEQAREALTRAAAAAVEAGSEVVAMELREGLEALGGVLGRMSPDDLLGKIFSEFCIGK